MRGLKLGLISAFFLFLLVFGMGLLFPSQVVVSRAVTVQAAPDSIKALFFSFGQWNKWMQQVSPQASPVPEDSFVLGTTRIQRLSQNDSVCILQWKMQDGSRMVSTFRVLPVREGNQPAVRAIVQWQFDQHIGWWPWERFASMMNDKILGAQMEENLGRLQQQAEQASKN